MLIAAIVGINVHDEENTQAVIALNVEDVLRLLGGDTIHIPFQDLGYVPSDVMLIGGVSDDEMDRRIKGALPTDTPVTDFWGDDPPIMRV